MKKTACLFAMFALISWTGVQAASHTDDPDKGSNVYLGAGLTSLALDNDRVPGVPTSSPSHSTKLGSVFLGYRFDNFWSADVSLGTDLDNVDVDAVAVNGYRYFGSGNWRPFISAGFSAFSIDDAVDDDTEQFQAGVGFAGNLNRNVELKVGYQSYFTLSGDSYQDNAIGATLAWHFKKPKAMPVSEPAPEPEPESVPEEKEVVQTYELRVQFEFDKSVIRSAYEPQFDEVAEILRNNPDITLTVEGHTCWIGTEQYNQALSERRANAVKQKFVDEHGIDASRIDTVGYGESRPVADNSTLAGRQRNRRAIAVVLQPTTVTQ